MEGTVVGIGRREHIPDAPNDYGEHGLAAVDALLEETLGCCVDLTALCRGNTVFIKPNLVRPDPRNPNAVVTDERVLLALIRLVRDAGAKDVLVGDNPGYGLSLEAALSRMGAFRRRVADAGARLVFFDDEETVVVDNPEARLFDRLVVPKAVLEADCRINLPKMKTHMHTLVTLGIKNLYGLVLDDQRMFFHRNDISLKLVDILRRIRPELTVVDGIWAVQGQAPLSGSAVPDMNTLVAGTDVVAVDTVCCALMGIEAHEVAMLRLAARDGLGCADMERIETRGTPVREAARRFKRPVVGCMGAYPEILAVEGGACQGCLSALRHALDKLHAEGRLAGKAPVTVYLGKPMPDMKNLKNPEGDVWCFGSCAADLIFDHCARGPAAKFIPGCPPHILEFYKAYIKTYDVGV